MHRRWCDSQSCIRHSLWDQVTQRDRKWSCQVGNRWRTRHSMPSLTGTTQSGAFLLQNKGRNVLTFQYRELLVWQTDTHQYSLCIMADWYTSVQSVYYDRLIHINTVCVLWHTDTHQYSLCIMAHWYTPIHRTLLFSSKLSLLSLHC